VRRTDIGSKMAAASVSLKPPTSVGILFLAFCHWDRFEENLGCARAGTTFGVRGGV
jgi:hypothetical protein